MLENDKPSFLLTLLANANCGWHGAVWHNLTGSRWFYYPEPDVVKFPNLCRISKTNTVQESLPFPVLPEVDQFDDLLARIGARICRMAAEHLSICLR